MAVLRPSNALCRQSAELLESVRMLLLQSRPLLEEDSKFPQTGQLRELAEAYGALTFADAMLCFKRFSKVATPISELITSWTAFALGSLRAGAGVELSLATSSPFALGAAASDSDMLPLRSCSSWGGYSGGSESSWSGLILSSGMAVRMRRLARRDVLRSRLDCV